MYRLLWAAGVLQVLYVTSIINKAIGTKKEKNNFFDINFPKYNVTDMMK